MERFERTKRLPAHFYALAVKDPQKKYNNLTYKIEQEDKDDILIVMECEILSEKEIQEEEEKVKKQIKLALIIELLDKNKTDSLDLFSGMDNIDKVAFSWEQIKRYDHEGMFYQKGTPPYSHSVMVVLFKYFTSASCKRKEWCYGFTEWGKPEKLYRMMLHAYAQEYILVLNRFSEYS